MVTMVSRWRKRFILILIVIFLFSTTGIALGLPKDVKGHWAEGVITEMYKNTVATGYNDNTFRPDSTITRAEFVALINRFFGYTETVPITFSDIADNSWYKADVARAIAAGYITGYEDNTFRPDNLLTRQEAAKILATLQKLESPEQNKIEIFTDAVRVKDWAFTAMNALVKFGVIKGYPDNTLRPEGYITRAEAVHLLKKILPQLQSVSLTNGVLAVYFDRAINQLSKDDIIVQAKIDNRPYDLQILSVLLNNIFMVSPIPQTNSYQTLDIAVYAAPNSNKIAGSASATITIPPYSPASPNEAPTKPVITRTPSSGIVTELTPVTITATSTDPDGDNIHYVWSGRIAETSVYPLGRHVVTVKAVDEHGAESEAAAIVFFVVDSATGSGGVMLIGPESRIYENGIDGATITHYTFNVPSVSGHWGDDYAWIKGLNVNTREWEEIEFEYTANGIYLEGSLPPGKYSRLEFFYYASHCMYGKSNITYTVDFVFTDLGPDVPPEAAPVAQGVTISGTAGTGEIVTGNYTYTDANGDLEGSSTYQWYHADDATGANKVAIEGATQKQYTVTSDDSSKYLIFEVTPVALTGVTGTITGNAAASTALLVPGISEN